MLNAFTKVSSRLTHHNKSKLGLALKFREHGRITLPITTSGVRHLSYDERNYLHQSKLSTDHFQRSLMRLPIPKLEETCTRYLAAQRVLLNDDDYRRTEDIVESFRDGEGKSLHDELVATDKKNKHTSYISGPWSDMYLKDRKPLVLTHNPFIAFNDDPRPEYNDQLVRATNFVMSSARFMKTLAGNILEPEVFHLNPKKSDTPQFRRLVGLLPKSIATYGALAFKAFPLDMSQYSRLFQSTRIPRPVRDELITDPNSRHLCVIRNGHIYTLDVLDKDGNLLPATEVMAHLQYILADTRPPAEHPIGILTTESRDNWTAAREKLVAAGHEEKLHKIDTAMFVLALEDSKSEEFIELSRMFLHGDQGGSRWFDKSFSLILSGTGKASVNFEHAWGDGVAVLRYFNEVYKDSTEKPLVNPQSQPSASVDSSAAVSKLDFQLTDDLKNDVRQAQANFQSAIAPLDLQYLQYKKYGKSDVKKRKISPDAFMQLAFQIAYYRQYQQTVATYESCSTAAFKHGRTETIRPATMATKTTSLLFDKEGTSPQELRASIEECSKVHGQLTKEAAMGKGFDRHLFGMKHIAAGRGSQVPEIFTDPAYAGINYNILSTSTLSSPAVLIGGFAPVVPDGYGLGYGIEDGYMGCNVTCYKPNRDVHQFLQIIENTFDDMFAILDGKRS